MKIIGITGTAILSLLLGIAAPAYAQHEQQAEKQDHPQQQQSKHEQAKPGQQQQKQEQNKQTQQHAQQQQKQEQNKQTQQHAQQQQKQEQNKQTQHAQQQRGNERPQRTQEQQRVQQSAWQQHRSQHWDSDHRNWQQRGGYHGYRIPDDRFRGYFGPEHGFRIYGLPFMVVGGYPRFQYQGYWISLVDPWPEYWGNDWYDNDDVYVAYVDNGYYLYNRRYPNVGIAIRISM
ncbi:MAG: hypothetical protein WCA27_02230 [Candidatus Sulfotelmatobacter sp.]